ncbi:(2Fe-2S)-binding protein [Aliidiomarina minuta]|uniref:Bacterioferritin-associated ferredoxin n=1 Tax=Aliidiomarina minuta TaxID=880057 RepID=A0A432W9N6_9GAMM|nr:bacterioferritin-associated ferredoxin [Aliidiomarina minuta]RUO26318.1 (2Fe-2S)-binding protein [Aliidiomarina minuta]
MYVCLCKAVTDKDIHRAVAQGAVSMRCLRQENGVGSQCGRCTCHAKEVLDEALQNQSTPVTVDTAPGLGMCYP